MLKTLAAAEKVARYKHAQLSAVRLAGDISGKIGFVSRRSASSPEYRQRDDGQHHEHELERGRHGGRNVQVERAAGDQSRQGFGGSLWPCAACNRRSAIGDNRQSEPRASPGTLQRKYPGAMLRIFARRSSVASVGLRRPFSKWLR
jgi:hypothetical protein